MKKRKGIRNIVLLSVLAIIGLVLTFASFDIPFTNYKFKGFANSIQMGLDLKGGVMAVYDATADEESEGDFDDQLNATIQRLSDLIASEGYTEATVTKQGDNQIRVEVPDVDDPDTILSLIGEPAELEITKEDRSTNPDAEVYLTGKHIVSAEAQVQQDSTGSYINGVSITFNKEGTEIFATLTKELVNNGNLYIYIGGELFSAPEVQAEIVDGKTFISGSMNSAAEAEEYAMKILSGTYSVKLQLSEKSIISATLGEDALFYGVISGIIGFVLICIFMCAVYKMLGVISSISLILYIGILMYLLAVIPFVQLTLPGIAGIILGIGMAVDANIIIFERIKDEYKSGKRISASVKSGFKKATMAILDSNITTIIASIVLALLGTGPIRGFAITLLISIVVSMFCSLLITRALTYSYLPINSTNPKLYSIKREVTNNETK